MKNIYINNIKRYLLFIIILIILIIILLVYYKNLDNHTKKIPKIIIQTWKTTDIPEKYNKDISSVEKYTNKYKYLFFTDEDIENFLKKEYPKYYITYQKLPVKIQKIDFFRYIAVYHYGGFYLDLDMTMLYPLDELLKYDSVFPVDQTIPNSKCNKSRFKKYCSIGLNMLLGQYAFGATKKNNFIKELIDNIHNNINKYIKIYKKNGKSDQYVYSTTGPDYVTDIYLKYNKKNNIHILNFNKNQYFGKYAKHNHYGTWKK